MGALLAQPAREQAPRPIEQVPAQDGGCDLDHGNAAMQEQLALQGSGPGFGDSPAEVMAWLNGYLEEEKALDDEIEYLADVVEALVHVRAQAVIRLHAATEPAEVPTWMLNEVLPFALAALSGATKGIAGLVGTALAGAVLDAKAAPRRTTLAAGVIEELIRPPIEGLLTSGVQEVAGHAAATGGTADAREAFFVATSNGLITAIPALRRAARAHRAVAREQSDPIGHVRALATQLSDAAMLADQQERATLREWMVLCARWDLGTTTSASGEEETDLKGAGSGRGWADILLDRHPRGVLRVGIRVRGEKVEVHSARLAGLNPEYIGKLAARTPRELGLPVFAAGIVEGPTGTARLEVGRNEAGSPLVRCDEAALGWLSRLGNPFGRGADDESAQEGADLLLERHVLDAPMASLGLVHG